MDNMANFILFTSLFGSIYLMSTSLGMINMSFLENKKIPYKLIIINGLTFLISSYVFTYISLTI